MLSSNERDPCHVNVIASIVSKVFALKLIYSFASFICLALRPIAFRKALETWQKLPYSEM